MNKWEVAYFCSACKTELSFGVVMGSHGICPYCGHNDNSTVCDHITKVRRWIWLDRPPWYLRLLLPSRGRWEYKNEQ
jgi:hypothetical protein